MNNNIESIAVHCFILFVSLHFCPSHHRCKTIGTWKKGGRILCLFQHPRDFSSLPCSPVRASGWEPALRMIPGPLPLPCQRKGRTQGLHWAFQCSDPLTVCQQIHWDNSDCNTLRRLNPRDWTTKMSGKKIFVSLKSQNTINRANGNMF